MQMLWRRGAFVSAIAVASTTLFAGTIRHDLDHIPYLQLGNQYESVGAVYVTLDFGSPELQGSQTLASGVLIAPNWVLTAAHVTDSLEGGFWTGIGFVPGQQDPNVGSPLLNPPGQPYHEIGGTISHPGWAQAREDYLANNPGDLLGAATAQLLSGYDIALIYLDNPVVDYAPIPLYTGTDEVGNVGTYAGYGMRGNGITGTIQSDELRRAGHNMIDLTGGSGAFAEFSERILLADFDNPDDPSVSSMGDGTALDLEYSIAPGDSGGPVYVDFEGDGLGPLLVGINSFNGAYGPGDPFPGDDDPNAQYGEFVGATRVSAFNSWILETMATVPEPGSLAVFGLGGLAILRRRQRAEH